MSKITIFTPKNPNGITRDMTAEEQAVKDADLASADADEQARLDAIENQKNLKASAKTKLMAGEPLTEEEASLMMGG